MRILNKIAQFVGALPGSASYIRNSGWMLAEQVAGIATGLVVGVLLTRHLGPEEYGVYTLALAVLGLALPVARLGSDTVLLREFVENRDAEARQKLLGAVFGMRLAAAVVLVSISWAAWACSGTQDATLLAIGVASIGLIFHTTEVALSYFQAEVRGKVVSLCTMVQLAVSTAVKIGLVATGAGMVAFLWLMVADKALLSLLLLRKLENEPVKRFWNRFDWRVIKQVWRDSWPLIFSGFITVIYARIDQVMIGAMLGKADLAYYGVGVRLTDLWLIFPTVLAVSLFPALANARKRDIELYRLRISRLYAGVMVLGISVGIIGCAISSPAVRWIFGDIFEPASQVFNIRIWDTVFVAVGMIMVKSLHLENLQRRIVWFSLVGAVVNISLNLVLIPRFGINGAATASVVSGFCAVIVAPAIHPATRAEVWLIVRSPMFVLRSVRLLSA